MQLGLGFFGSKALLSALELGLFTALGSGAASEEELRDRVGLPAADVLVLGHILHDWGTPDKVRLLRAAFDALPDGGALIVYDAIIDDERRNNAFGLLTSLNMLVETREGYDYTGRDCRGWMADVGFRDSYVEPLAGPVCMVVATYTLLCAGCHNHTTTSPRRGRGSCACGGGGVAHWREPICGANTPESAIRRLLQGPERRRPRGHRRGVRQRRVGHGQREPHRDRP
jgi:hypothetical protein